MGGLQAYQPSIKLVINLFRDWLRYKLETQVFLDDLTQPKIDQHVFLAVLHFCCSFSAPTYSDFEKITRTPWITVSQSIIRTFLFSLVAWSSEEILHLWQVWHTNVWKSKKGYGKKRHQFIDFEFIFFSVPRTYTSHTNSTSDFSTTRLSMILKLLSIDTKTGPPQVYELSSFSEASPIAVSTGQGSSLPFELRRGPHCTTQRNWSEKNAYSENSNLNKTHCIFLFAVNDIYP